MLIGFSGEIDSGKSFAANYLLVHHKFVVDSFAAPIKDLTRHILMDCGINKTTAESMITGPAKNTPQAHFIDTRRLFDACLFAISEVMPDHALFAKKLAEILYHDPIKSGRSIQQLIGTEWGRNTIDPEIWIDMLAIRTRSAERLVIDDMRHNNEYDYVSDSHGLTVLIEPTANPSGKHKQITDHSSEADWPSFAFDEVIHNDFGPGLGKALDALVL